MVAVCVFDFALHFSWFKLKQAAHDSKRQQEYVAVKTLPAGNNLGNMFACMEVQEFVQK